MCLLIGANAISQFGSPHMIGSFVTYPLHHLLGPYPRFVEQGERVLVHMTEQFGILGLKIVHFCEGTLNNAPGEI